MTVTPETVLRLNRFIRVRYLHPDDLNLPELCPSCSMPFFEGEVQYWYDLHRCNFAISCGNCGVCINVSEEDLVNFDHPPFVRRSPCATCGERGCDCRQVEALFGPIVGALTGKILP